MAASGAAVKLRRLRQRFGISAPKVAVRTHIPWYWRGLAIVAMLSVSLALARWIYDAGRSIAGFDSSSTTQKIDGLKAKLASLGPISPMPKLQPARPSNLRIDRSAQQQLAQQVRHLESENLALKRDLAFFEGLLPDAVSGEAGVHQSLPCGARSE